MYFFGARTDQIDITYWIVSLFYCTLGRYLLLFCGVLFIYFVEMVFSYIAYMVLAVDILSVEYFKHARLDFLLMCGLSMVAKY